MNKVGEEGCGGGVRAIEVIFDIRSLDVNMGQVQKNGPNKRQGVIAIIGSTTRDEVEHSKRKLKSIKLLTGNLRRLELPNQNICMH